MTYFSLYQRFCEETSQLMTKKYSSSFSRSIIFLAPEIRKNIYNVYGFVRLADEIVDTFHDFDKKSLLDKFTKEYRTSLQDGISYNPIIHAFCETQKRYQFPQHLVDAFLHSMYMDLGDMKSVNQELYEEYIYGSAEVVGLMCLMIFVDGNKKQHEALKPTAKSLGAALQKVNFLRDINADYHDLNRTYFPNVDFKNFTKEDKIKIEKDIQHDFDTSLKGIKKLPLSSKFAVYLAYRYYRSLFNKIKNTHSSAIFQKRISVSKFEKLILFSKIMLYKKFNLSTYIR